MSLPPEARYRNSSISSGMSSLRSRSGGRWIGMMNSRKKKSSRMVPLSMQDLRSRLVAATMRMSELRSSVEPMGTNTLSSRKRRSLTCMFRGSSATSSRNSVPRLALSSNPCLLA